MSLLFCSHLLSSICVLFLNFSFCFLILTLTPEFSAVVALRHCISSEFLEMFVLISFLGQETSFGTIAPILTLHVFAALRMIGDSASTREALYCWQSKNMAGA